MEHLSQHYAINLLIDKNPTLSDVSYILQFEKATILVILRKV